MLELIELRDHYRSLHTNELLAMSVSAELTEAARPILAAELDRRGVTAADYELARQTEAAIAAERQRTRTEFATRLKVQLGLIAGLALIALIVKLFE